MQYVLESEARHAFVAARAGLPPAGGHSRWAVYVVALFVMLSGSEVCVYTAHRLGLVPRLDAR